MTMVSVEKLARDFADAAANANWAVALDCATRLQAALPDNPSVLYNTALVLKHLDRTEERVGCLEQALALAPDHANARFELASALMDEGDIERAAGLFSAYLAAAPDDADARLNLGNCLLRLGRAAEALPHLRQAHASAPTDVTAASLAAALRDTGDIGGCEAQLAALPPSPETAALRLKLLTQGARGRFALDVGQFRLAR